MGVFWCSTCVFVCDEFDLLHCMPSICWWRASMIFIHVANFSVAELHKLTDKLSFSDCTVFQKHQKTTLFPMSGGNVVLKTKQQMWWRWLFCFGAIAERGVKLTASVFMPILSHKQLLSIFSRSTWAHTVYFQYKQRRDAARWRQHSASQGRDVSAWWSATSCHICITPRSSDQHISIC